MYEFDLNPLRRPHDYHVKGGEYDFVLNMCGPLQEETCGGGGGIGICQTKPSVPSFKINAGKYKFSKVIIIIDMINIENL